MSTLLVLGKNRDIFNNKTVDPDRNIEFFESEQNAYLYQLQHPDAVDSYLIVSENFDAASLKKLVRHIIFLNEIIPVYILGLDSVFEDEEFAHSNINYCNTIEDVITDIKAITEIRRKDNRVRWPVAAEYWLEGNSGEKSRGRVVSISSGGCLVMGDSKPEIDRPVVASIIFRKFDFLVEGTVVRHDTHGFALKFKNISSSTLNVIKNIINERILVELRDLN